MSTHSTERQPRYLSHAAFYADVFPDAVTQIHRVGSFGAHLMHTRQGGGDWSDASTPDLSVTMARRSKGHSAFDLGGGRFERVVRPGDWVVKAPFAATQISCEGDHMLVTVGIPYSALRAAGGPGSGLPDDGDFGALHSRVNRDPAVRRLLIELAGDADSPATKGALHADGVILQLGARLAALRSGRPAAPRPRRPGRLDAEVHRAAERLRDDLSADVGVAELARDAGVSPRHFVRAFSAVMGSPPHRWLTAVRLQRARELLADPAVPITDIAYRCGYSSSQHFATTFKAYLAMTPSEYRRLLQA